MYFIETMVTKNMYNFLNKTMLSFVMNVLGPISSSLVNKYGCRPVTIAGAVLAGFCMAISVFANNVIFLYITIGLGTGKLII